MGGVTSPQPRLTFTYLTPTSNHLTSQALEISSVEVGEIRARHSGVISEVGRAFRLW